MHRYFIKTPWWVKRLFSDYIWSFSAVGNEVYLTFDDGPHPTITPWVLDELKKYNATATFFCIGKNVVQYPEIYSRILNEGHAVGNHTYNHVNGWKVDAAAYCADVEKAAVPIKSNLFRPPYGRIKKSQFEGLKRAMNCTLKVIMWDVLSADFDEKITPEICALNVTRHVRPGSVVVFHDSEKTSRNLKYALPKTLEFLKSKGYISKKIRS